MPTLDLTIVPQPYRQRFGTLVLRFAPRMGFSSNIGLLASEDPDYQFEYTSGIVFVGSFFLVLIVMWGILLAICAWLGSDQVGFISGDRMKPADNKAKRGIVRNRTKVVRCTFVINALLWVIFALVFLLVGLQNLDDAQQIVQNQFPAVDLAVANAAAINAELQNKGEEAQVARDSLVSNLQSMCPSNVNLRRAQEAVVIPDESPIDFGCLFGCDTTNPDPSGAPIQATAQLTPTAQAGFFSDSPSASAPFPPSFVEGTTSLPPSSQTTSISDFPSPALALSPSFVPGNLTGLMPSSPLRLGGDSMAFSEIAMERDASISALIALDDFIAKELQQGQIGIDDADQILNIVESELVSAKIPVLPAIILAFPWVLVPLILVGGVYLAHRGRIKPSGEKVMKYCSMVLILMIMTSIGVATAFSAYGIANADFCSGGSANVPEATIAEVVMARGFNSSTLYYNAMRFYATQCTSSDPFIFLETYRSDLWNASNALQTLANLLTASKLEELSIQCGFNSVDGIDSMIVTMKQDVDELAMGVETGLALLQCDNLVPMFTTIAYDAACDQAVHGLFHSWVSFLMMSITGMIMLTLRSSYLKIDEVGSENKITARGGEDLENGTDAESEIDDVSDGAANRDESSEDQGDFSEEESSDDDDNGSDDDDDEEDGSDDDDDDDNDSAENDSAENDSENEEEGSGDDDNDGDSEEDDREEDDDSDDSDSDDSDSS